MDATVLSRRTIIVIVSSDDMDLFGASLNFGVHGMSCDHKVPCALCELSRDRLSES